MTTPANSPTVHEVPPAPARMAEGLRDTGYQFNTAVADIVDNSISAEASYVEVELDVKYDGQVKLRIWDDGIGMDEKGLLSAMQYGAPERTSKASLGKFGLGLKTASTAFCRALTVVSRVKPTETLNFARWDLDIIKQTDKWQLHAGPCTPALSGEFDKHLSGKKGTLVCWDKVDRVLKSNPKPTQAKIALNRIEESLRHHLATVFQRYLDPTDQRARTVKISLNGIPVEAWDPFCAGRSLLEGQQTFNVEDIKASFTVRAFILPRKEEFTAADGQWDKEAWQKARLSPGRQGIYVYREGRLIHGPDWLGMGSKETHLTLLRVEFSFDHKLDDAFQVDIKKSQIILDDAINNSLEDFLRPIRREADARSRKGLRKHISEEGKNAHDASNRRIGSNFDDIKTPVVKAANAATGIATISNATGDVKLKLSISSAQRPGELFIQPVDEIQDGLLWAPALIDGKPAVQINKGHPYYSKVYVPNIVDGPTIQGMDALLWGIAVAEMNCVSDGTRRVFEELRFEVSRNLRRLIDDLPDPEVPE